MILKESRFAATNEYGPTVLPLFNRATDAFFEKTASHFVVPEVLKYIETVRPENDACYTLVNALGASEFYSSNSNADAFPESSLIHRPDRWTGNPLLDASVGKQWAYGFPTFYGAHAYPHHRNKDPNKSLGDVTFVCWNDRMKRVELVTRVTKDRCLANGGQAIWDKLQSGQYAEVSMGCFKADTMVTMSDGRRKYIQDVAVGDFVLTHLGRPRKVLATQRYPYKGKIYSIKPEAGATIFCTEEHPFFAVTHAQSRKITRGNVRWRDELVGSPDWVAASDLDRHSLVEPVLAGVLTPDYATREFCRLLGYYLAEGTILNNKAGEPSGVSFSTHVSDAIHQEVTELCAAVGTNNPPTWYASSSSEFGTAVTVFDPWLAKMCLALAGKGSKTKRLAESVMHWHPDLQAEFLSAYMNGDGCYAGHGALNISTSNRDLAFQVQTMLPRLGVASSMQGLTHKAGKGFSRTATKEWVIHIGKQYVDPFLGICAKARYEPILLTKNSRKFEGEWLLTPVRKYSHTVEETEVFNLEVEEDNSFQVNNIAVHNSRVPFDNCAICTDWNVYRKAKATFDPKKHPYEGAAVLEWHKAKPIRGVAITRATYCEHMLKTPNKILPDGRKVFVYNDYPRFFDISYVFIGADKTAKTLMHLSRPGMTSSPSDAFVKKAAQLFPGMDKTAAATPKTSAVKSSEMYKEDIPSQFIPAAVATVTRRERDLPDDMLHRLSDSPLESMLATLGSAGVVLRPREFQRVVLIQGGMEELADKLDSRGSVFPRCSADPDFHLSHGDILPDVVKEILPFLSQRSALKEPLHIRVVISSGAEPLPVKTAAAPSLLSEPLRKISSRYTAYRSQLMETLSHAPTFLSFASDTGIGGKVASKLASELFSPLTVGYIQSAFWDEVAPPPLLNGQEPA